jgi:hypothetical protein
VAQRIPIDERHYVLNKVGTDDLPFPNRAARSPQVRVKRRSN